MSSDVLVVGKSGQVASCLKEILQNAGFVGSSDWNLSEYDVKKYLDRHYPKVLINAAAYTAVDKAEVEQDQALLLNSQLPLWLAEWCKSNGSKLIHYSTDYVYDGSMSEPHCESEALKPLNFYGKSKALGEESINRVGPSAVVLRISWIYSVFGSNFLKTMIRLGKEKEILNVVSDQVGTPTSANDIARVTQEIIASTSFADTTDFFNYAPLGFVSWYEFASEIFKEYAHMNSDLKLKTLNPILSSEYPTPAQRPLNSRLNCMKFDKKWGLARKDWRASLKSVMVMLYGNQKI